MTSKLEAAKRDQQWYECNMMGVSQEEIALTNGVDQSYVSRRINIHREKVDKIGTSRTVEKTLLRKELFQGEVEYACKTLEWADFDNCKTPGDLCIMASGALRNCSGFVCSTPEVLAKLRDFFDRAHNKAASLDDPFYAEKGRG